MFLPSFRDHTLAPTTPGYHIPFLYQAYWFHQNVSVQNLNEYVFFPDSLDKKYIMPLTEDERFSQHITTVKPLKLPSVFRPPGSITFLYHGMLKIYQIRAGIVRQFVSISEIKTTVTPIASIPAVKFPLNILLTTKTISTLAKDLGQS